MCLLPILAALLAAGSLQPSTPARTRAQDTVRPAGEADDALLERWRSLTSEQREVLRRRFEEFGRMDEGRRAELHRRLERLRQIEREVEHRLPPGVRERLEGLPPHERRELLHEHVADEFFERGRRCRRLLPPELRAQLEQAAPQERERLLLEQRARSERHLGAQLSGLGHKLGLAPEDVQSVLALPPEDQRAKLLELRRAELVLRVRQEGLPTWIAPQDWEAWRSLSDQLFFECLNRGRGGRPLEGGRSDELRRLLRPDPQWFAELTPLPREQRRAELERRMRSRILDFLDQHPEALPPGELERLRALGEDRLIEALRERLCEGDGGRARHQRRGERRP